MIRESVIAGSWYPDDEEELSKEIESYLNNAGKSGGKKPLSIISPHAGYIYSGQVAAYSYKQIEGKTYKRVIVIAPSHHYRIQGCALFDTGAFSTPLGTIPVDEESCTKLVESDSIFQREKAPHIEEHSVEIQLPFLQKVLGNFMLIPILCNENDIEVCRQIAKSIYGLMDDETLLIASTDLSHYYRQEEAKKLDSTLIENIKKVDAEVFVENIKKGKCEACGSSPVTIALVIGELAENPLCEIFKYATSGDVSGDYERVVGYLAAGLYKQ